MPVTIDSEKCDACLKCADVCPNQGIEKINNGTKDTAKVIDDNCIDCYLCVPECQTGALQQP
jgi:ferredoxin